MNERARNLVDEIVSGGAPFPEIGYELPGGGGWAVEAAWPLEKVAILIDFEPELEEWLSRSNWIFKIYSSWTVGEVLQALSGR